MAKYSLGDIVFNPESERYTLGIDRSTDEGMHYNWLEIHSEEKELSNAAIRRRQILRLIEREEEKEERQK